jgi:hypothetical protein
MAENPNGRVATEQTTDGSSRSVAGMRSAIRDTRDRLDVRLGRTADHVHLLFTPPSSVETGSPRRRTRRWSNKDDRRRRARQARLDRREENGPPRPSSNRRCGRDRRGCARDDETTSLTWRIEQPEGTEPGGHRRRRRYETAESDLGVSTDRPPDHPGVWDFHQQGCSATFSRDSIPADTRLGGAVLADAP